MKFETGKYYKTRDGKKAFVMFSGQNPFLDPKNRWTVYGVIGNSAVHSWDSEGKSQSFGGNHPNDLVEEWDEPITKALTEEWTAQWFGRCCSHNTRNFAEFLARKFGVKE